MDKVKENKESKLRMIRNKAIKRWENKMQKTNRERSQRSVKKGEKAEDFEDGTTDQPVALEGDSDVQGEFSLHYLFIVIVNSLFVQQQSHWMVIRPLLCMPDYRFICKLIKGYKMSPSRKQ